MSDFGSDPMIPYDRLIAQAMSRADETARDRLRWLCVAAYLAWRRDGK